jgi:imidazolonepropionase-like amidohydrolase
MSASESRQPSAFVVQGARVFDGVSVLDGVTVAVDGGHITAVADHFDTDGYDVIDGTGGTLLPGLIESHAHPTGNALALALLFGVTTEMDMFTVPERLGDQRKMAAERNDVADIRSASTGATVLGGHPSRLIGRSFREQFPVVTGAADAAQFVRDRVAEGADFIKLLIDDGTAKRETLPTLSEDVARIIVDTAHEYGLLAVAHATSVNDTLTAVRAGVDGLVHVFMDQPTEEAVEAIAKAGVFVVPTLVTVSAIAGDITSQTFADDERARRFIPDDWHSNLGQRRHPNIPSSLANAMLATGELHRAGVTIVAGTDAADVGIAGNAHGVSLHQELALLVDCGLTPSEALTAATSSAAAKFRLTDRGRIAAGLQADLLLVSGDPTTDITDTLSIREIWRRGDRLDRQPPAMLGERSNS